MLKKGKANRKLRNDRNIINLELKIGDKVLIKNETGLKLKNNYLGPYTFEEIVDKNNLTIVGNKKKHIVHKERLNRFKS